MTDNDDRDTTAAAQQDAITLATAREVVESITVPWSSVQPDTYAAIARAYVDLQERLAAVEVLHEEMWTGGLIDRFQRDRLSAALRGESGHPRCRAHGVPLCTCDYLPSGQER